MKKLKSFLAFLAAAALVFTLAACEQASDADKSPFAGTWTDGMLPLGGTEWVFTSTNINQKVNFGSVVLEMSGTYTYDSEAKTLTISYIDMGTMTYTYEFSGSTLTLTDEEGEDTVLTKQ
ncbi:hypothetical protein K7J14_04380 [Treponema zuelzerae]|uniref:DUF5640 domain-containing protein n=1 Tax=Teretinema zuelzerae TaxID=156 RepID=A0AAE3EHX3_9SPIR|nr:hypothetical protein [Teretinema zuelzerae]MCD1653933.1 hypothetical protein [Teretinema zuelzerae]